MAPLLVRPQPLEVRVSRAKFALVMAFYVPLLTAVPLTIIWSWPAAGSAGRFDSSELWVSALFAAVAWPLFIRYFLQLLKALAMEDFFLRLTPKGLVMPSLGSIEPISWDRVNAEIQPGRDVFRAMTFRLRVNPERHTKVLGTTPLFRRGDNVVVTVPSIFDASRAHIFKTIVGFKAFTSLNAE
jgi:hypothetical protein